MNSINTDTLILGDLHLGKKHNASYGDASIWDNRSLEILEKLLVKYKPKQLILAGDVFDSSKPTALVYSEFLGVITKVPEVYIIAGNHDISKVTEDIAFDNLDALKNVTLIKYQTILTTDSFTFIGWQPTQDVYDKVLKGALEKTKPGSIIVTHCSRLDFGNEMDNICTDEHIELAKFGDIKIVSGHEHSSSITNNFVHLGSVVPHTISEVGNRYYFYNNKFLKIEASIDIVLTREEPLVIDPDKVYYVKTGKEVTVEDLKMETKDLSVDILQDFWIQANIAGFEKGLLND